MTTFLIIAGVIVVAMLIRLQVDINRMYNHGDDDVLALKAKITGLKAEVNELKQAKESQHERVWRLSESVQRLRQEVRNAKRPTKRK